MCVVTLIIENKLNLNVALVTLEAFFLLLVIYKPFSLNF